MVGTALNLAGLESLLREVTTQACDVVGSECHVIHAVRSFRIGSRTIAHPLHSGHVAHCLAGFDRRRRSQTECIDVEFFNAVSIRRVERDVIDPGDVWARGALGVRNDREDCGDE